MPLRKLSITCSVSNFCNLIMFMRNLPCNLNFSSLSNRALQVTLALRWHSLMVLVILPWMTSCITADANSFGQAGNMHSPESIGGGGGLLFLLLPSISMSRRWQQRRQVTKSISGAAGCSKSGRVVLHSEGVTTQVSKRSRSRSGWSDWHLDWEASPLAYPGE